MACAGTCCSGEQVCGTRFDPNTFDEFEGCCLPPGAVLPGGCDNDNMVQCCDTNPTTGGTTVSCITDETTGTAYCA